MPLAAAAALLIAIDFIGLGMHLADATNNAATADQPLNQARTRVTAPNAVVNADSLDAVNATSGRTRTTTASGVLIGPVAPPVVTPGGTASAPTTPSPSPTPSPPPANPLVQSNVGVPALGANVGLGLGDGSCTTVDLTLLALGDCPAPDGEGAVIVQLGGSLLGN